MSVTHLTRSSAEGRDDVNPSLAFLNAAKCNVAAIGRPNRIVVNGLLLRKAQWFLSPDELHIDAEERAVPSVPGEGQLLAVRRQTWTVFLAHAGYRKDYRRLRRFGLDVPG